MRSIKCWFRCHKWVVTDKGHWWRMRLWQVEICERCGEERWISVL